MKKEKKTMNEDQIKAENLKKYIHITLGRLLRFVRLSSSLSHLELMKRTSINSGAIWRMESLKNCSTLSFMQAFCCYLDSIKSKFYLHHLCHCIANSIQSGKSIVIIFVDSSELKNYPQKQIIFEQQSDDKEELERRHTRQEALLLKNRKLGQTRWQKKELSRTRQKKKGGKKPQNCFTSTK